MMHVLIYLLCIVQKQKHLNGMWLNYAFFMYLFVEHFDLKHRAIYNQVRQLVQD